MLQLAGCAPLARALRWGAKSDFAARCTWAAWQRLGAAAFEATVDDNDASSAWEILSHATERVMLYLEELDDGDSIDF